MHYSSVISAIALATLASAQTFTSCDPTKKTCPADPALGKTVSIDFTKGASDDFTLAEGTTLTYGENGAEFTIKSETQAPTITSKWYIFFGKVEVVMKAAPGVGIVSSFVMESDDLDEIDWEWLGGDATQVETNYFGKGNTTTYDRATYATVATPQDTFHTYTIEWKSTAITWAIDGTVIRTLAYADANGGQNFPQTPMQVKLGNWDGGSSTAAQGTVQWAGGLTNFDDAPFVMYVKSLTVQDYSTGGASYVYSDNSGSWESIKTSGSVGSSSGGSSSSGSSSATGSSSTASGSSKPSSTVPHINSTASTKTSAPSSEATTSSSKGSGNLGAGAVTQSVGTSTAGTTFVVSTTANTEPTGSSTSSSTSSSSAPTQSTNAGSRQVMAKYVVGGLGLGLGYLLM